MFLTQLMAKKVFVSKCRLFILKIILSYFGFHWPLPGDLYRKCYIIGNVHDFKSSYYLIVLDSKVVFSYYRFVKFCFPVAVLCFGQKRILYKFDIHENPSWTVKPWIQRRDKKIRVLRNDSNRLILLPAPNPPYHCISVKQIKNQTHKKYTVKLELFLNLI